MHLVQILVKISLKPVNSMSFKPIFLTLRNLNSKKFWNFETQKTQPQPQRGNQKESKLDQALHSLYCENSVAIYPIWILNNK